MEREAYRNIEVMWLLGDLKPDHWTICKFRRENKDLIRSIAIAFRKFLLDNGFTTPQELDEAVKASIAPRMMVLGLAQRMDFTGLDVALAIQKIAVKQTLPKPTFRTLEELVKSGRVGIKSGKGFYDYSDKTREEILRERDKKLIEIFKGIS